MKKIAIISSIILLLTILGILVITGMHNAEKKDPLKEKTKIGLILNYTRNDRSWGQSHYESLQKVSGKLNLEILVRDFVTENKYCIHDIEDLIKKGCKIIIADSYGYGPYLYALSEKYPDVYFFHTSGLQSGKNFMSYFGRIYQMRYLSGIVAGLQTETNEIGYVAASPIPEVIRGIDAFTLGVRSVNPEAKVFVSFSGSWSDGSRTSNSIGRLMIRHKNIDVFAMHTNSLKVLEYCEAEGIWSIGYNLDNSSSFPKTFLTSPVWNWEVLYGPKIEEVIQGKFTGGHFWFDADTDIMSLSPFTKNVKPGIARKVTEAKRRLSSGSWDVFYGPVYDNEGKLRVNNGENLSDEVLLETLDWFVEGVYCDVD